MKGLINSVAYADGVRIGPPSAISPATAVAGGHA